MNESFEIIWQRILENQGNEFLTITKKKFTYTIGQNDEFIPSIPKKVPYNSNKENLRKAYIEWPKEKPSYFSNGIVASSYVWGVLSDSRIIKKEN